jgi:hypothetical protein
MTNHHESTTMRPQSWSAAKRPAIAGLELALRQGLIEEPFRTAALDEDRILRI